MADEISAMNPTENAKEFQRALYHAADLLVPAVDGRRQGTDTAYAAALNRRLHAIGRITRAMTYAVDDADLADPNVEPTSEP